MLLCCGVFNYSTLGYIVYSDSVVELFFRFESSTGKLDVILHYNIGMRFVRKHLKLTDELLAVQDLSIKC